MLSLWWAFLGGASIFSLLLGVYIGACAKQMNTRDPQIPAFFLSGLTLGAGLATSMIVCLRFLHWLKIA